MDRVLRLATITGLVFGAWGLMVVFRVVGFNSELNIQALSSPWTVFDIFFFFALFFLTPSVSLIGSILLLVRPWSPEQRGIIGFITFISGLLSMVIAYLMSAWIVG